MRKQFVDPICGMSLDPGEDIREVRDRIHPVLLARCDKCVEHSMVMPGFLVTDEEEVRPSESDPAQSGFCHIVHPTRQMHGL